jgi:hypothetical protein
MTEADLADFLSRARRAQAAIDEAIEKVIPTPELRPEPRSRMDGRINGNVPAPVPQQVAAGTRRTRNLQNQDAHGRLLTLLVRDLKRHRRVAWLVRVNTGGFLSPDGKRRIRCGWKGQLDLLGQLRTGQMLAIEGKTGTGRASAEQRATIATITANGGCAFVARSVADAWAQLNAFKARY